MGLRLVEGSLGFAALELPLAAGDLGGLAAEDAALVADEGGVLTAPFAQRPAH